MKSERIALHSLILIHHFSSVKRLLILIAVSLIAAGAARAQNDVGPLELDSVFATQSGTPGRIAIDFNGRADIATCFVSYFNRVTRQVTPVYVAGKAGNTSSLTFGISRYMPDGAVDPTFGTNGKSIPFSTGTVYPLDMLLLPNGALRAAGYSDPTQSGLGKPTLFGVTSTGHADMTFGTLGTAQSANAKLSAGTFTTLDTVNLGSGTQLVAMGYSSVTDATGKSGFFASRVDSSGRFDATFGEAGIALIPAAIQSARGHVFFIDSVAHEQHLVFVGVSSDPTPELLLGRLRQGGAIDSTFGVAGVVHTGLHLQGGTWFTSKSYHAPFYDSLGHVRFFDDKVIVAAPLFARSSGTPISLISFNLDGTVDTSYGSLAHLHGIISPPDLASMDSATSLTFTNDGSLLVCGNINGYGAVAKLFYVGIVDSTFGINGLARLDNGFGSQHYSLLGFNPLGGGAQVKRFIAIGTTTDGTNSDFLISRFVPVPILQIAPTSLDFGSVDTGKSRTLTITIKNYDTLTHIIDSVTAQVGSPFTIVQPVQPVALRPGDSVVVDVSFRPTQIFVYNVSLTIFDHPQNQEVTRRSVLASGRGVAGSASVEQDRPEQFSVTPNPATTTLSIGGVKLLEYRIIDALGRIVAQNSSLSNTIDVSRLSAGMYLLDARSAEGHYVRRFTIEH